MTYSPVDASQDPRPLVVVVDDEPIMRHIMATSLEGHYRVLVTENGKEALELFAFAGQDISAVVTDIRMPVMDGLAFAAELRDRAIPVPILFVSGFAVIGEAPGSLLPKPFSPGGLLEAVKQMLADRN